MTVQLLIPAAGMGARLGARGPKALLDLGGKPLIVRTLGRFTPLGLVDGAVIVVPPDHRDGVEEAVYAAFPGAGFLFVEGGAERQISVGNGLEALDPAAEIVVIHDAARPFVSPQSVAASIRAAEDCGAATVAIPCVDTILVADAPHPTDAQHPPEAYLLETPDRGRLWSCQTPQTFRVGAIREAHAAAQRDGYIGTDDASLVRRLGRPVRLVLGTPLNLKITTPSDLALAQCIIRAGLAAEN